MKAWYRIGAVMAAVAASGGCSSSADGLGSGGTSPANSEFTGNTAAGSSSGGGGFNSGGASGGGATAAGMGETPALPPEVKSESIYQSPVATGNVVWIADPTSGRVAFIDATTFAVQTIEAGDGPTYLAAVPDPNDDVAVVLNVISDDATLLRRSPGGNLTSATFASTNDANSWAISASGRWAIAWTDASRVSNTVAVQGFEEIAVMDLSTATSSGVGKTTFLNVGYRPSQIAFSGDSEAFAVTQDGISPIALTASSGPVVMPFYALSAAGSYAPPAADASSAADAGGGADAGADATSPAPGDAASDAVAASDASTSPEATTPPDTTYDSGTTEDDGGTSGTPDVSFTPGGTYALVRQDGLATITVITLADGTLTTVPLPSAPTDLTLSPAGDFAVAVLRDTSTVAVLPLPGIVSNPTNVTMIPIPGETIGRAIVTQGGKTALLFTTAAAVDRLTVLTLQPPSFRTIELRAPVLAVFPTPDAQNAVVLHDETASVAGVQGAFSLVPIGANLPVHIVPVTAPPTGVAIAPASDRVIVSLGSDTSSTYGLDLALLPSQQVIQLTLASPPIATGIAAGAGQGYAAQNYSEGRITFVDLYSPDGGTPGAARTITGFELAARVVDGRDQ